MDVCEAHWQAVVERDRSADGQFFYAVKSTGIYCRPTCPSRRPARENVAFFDSAEGAEAAGFRPCRRCRPREISAEARLVAEVRRLLETAEGAPTLVELGQAVGMSPTYLQRLFKRATGLSPREYASHCRSERLKRGLKEGALVTDALYAAGYGSARALYEKAGNQLGMTPGAYRSGGAGEAITYGCAQTPLGRLLVAVTARGVCALRFGEDDAALAAELAGEFPRAALTEDPGRVEAIVQAVLAHLDGQQPALDLPLDVKATAFQQRVWGALRAIPYGEVRSYSQVAEMIGEPAAVRAVARACASNPVALTVPCHRVVRASGELSGYRWGVERKRTLLAQERTVVNCKGSSRHSEG